MQSNVKFDVSPQYLQRLSRTAINHARFFWAQTTCLLTVLLLTHFSFSGFGFTGSVNFSLMKGRCRVESVTSSTGRARGKQPLSRPVLAFTAYSQLRK